MEPRKRNQTRNSIPFRAVVAGLAGAGVPLLLRRLRMDPAVSSAVFVTTFTDVIGFLMFLGRAAAFINRLT